MKWLADGGISVDAPNKPKKITGTRFGAVLGLNPFSTPFNAWCEITKTYQEPFEDTIYTLAGKKLESKQIDYMKLFYEGVKTPTDMFGADYFKRTRGDFFPDEKIFGGMWDALIQNDNLKAVIECKTTKRVEDWKDDIPEYYSLQAALYATLLGYDDVIFVCTCLDEDDYYNISEFEVNIHNTFTRKFKVSERYPDIDKMMEYCMDWYEDTVLTGMSPIPAEADTELLKKLHTIHIDVDADFDELIAEFETLKTEIDTAKKSMSDIEKRYKLVSESIKNKILKDAKKDDRFEISGNKFTITVTPSKSESVDVEQMKKDGIYDKYKIVKEASYTMRVKEIK